MDKIESTSIRGAIAPNSGTNVVLFENMMPLLPLLACCHARYTVFDDDAIVLYHEPYVPLVTSTGDSKLLPSSALFSYVDVIVAWCVVNPTCVYITTINRYLRPARCTRSVTDV